MVSFGPFPQMYAGTFCRLRMPLCGIPPLLLATSRVGIHFQRVSDDTRWRVARVDVDVRNTRKPERHRKVTPFTSFNPRAKIRRIDCAATRRPGLRRDHISGFIDSYGPGPVLLPEAFPFFLFVVIPRV